MKVFFDIDTQLDFLVPGGALYGPGAEKLLPAIASLNSHAAARGIPLISTTDAHPENAAEFQVWPPHCVAGTFGQRKPGATLLAKHAVVPFDPAFDPASIDLTAEQIIVEKNALDMFTNPHVPALLDKLAPKPAECIVYGIFVDYCVKCALLGLVKSGRQVCLVTDASASISEEAGSQVIQDFLTSGGRLATLSEIMAG